MTHPWGNEREAEGYSESNYSRDQPAILVTVLCKRLRAFGAALLAGLCHHI